MAHQFDYLAFDSLTAVAFGADYNTVEDPKFSFLRSLLTSRLENEASPRDIFSFLQQYKDPETGEGLNTMELSTETETFLVAGLDTTLTTMSALSYYLSVPSRCYHRVAKEVGETFKSSDETRLGPVLNSCVYIRACVDETLRISSPGGATFRREVEAGGGSFGGDFISKGCEVGVAVYIMHRHPAYWDDPLAYKPERWLSSRNKMKEQTNSRLLYFTFSIVSRSCVGKPLATSQIMLIFARLFWEFDFRRADVSRVSSGVKNDEEGDGVRLPEYVLTEHIVA